MIGPQGLDSRGAQLALGILFSRATSARVSRLGDLSMSVTLSDIEPALTSLARLSFSAIASFDLRSRAPSAAPKKSRRRQVARRKAGRCLLEAFVYAPDRFRYLLSRVFLNFVLSDLKSTTMQFEIPRFGTSDRSVQDVLNRLC